MQYKAIWRVIYLFLFNLVPLSTQVQQTINWYFSYFPRKIGFDMSCKLSPFCGKKKKKKKKNSICCLLKILTSMQSVKSSYIFQTAKVLKMRSVVMQCFRDHYISRGYFEVLIYNFICSTSDCLAGLHSSVNSASDFRSRGCKFESQLGHFTFTEIVHEIVSMVIVLIPLTQEGHVQMRTQVQVNCWERLACPGKKYK